ncbi:C-X-C chemokine receptor type 1-like [Oratosquilla oratoria]|uniref:C-X-C chemokine receptor type 1-like n=1 Tax=Oratosquilla oratoria TaxID=337810 RepID=UPI003F776EEE
MALLTSRTSLQKALLASSGQMAPPLHIRLSGPCWQWALNLSAPMYFYPKVPVWFKILITSLDAILILTALLGNALIIYILVVVRERNLRLTALMACLAVSNLLMVLFLPLVDLPYLWHDEVNWVLGDCLCHVGPVLQAFSVLSNSTAQVAIAVDRYLGIVHSLSNLQRSLAQAWKAPHVSVYIVWVLFLALGVSIPYGFYFELTGPFIAFEKDTMEVDCFVEHYACTSSGALKDHLFEYQLVLVVNIFLPLVLTFIVCYGNLVYFLWFRQWGPAGQGGPRQEAQVAKKKKVVKTLMGVVLLFLICCTPSWAFLLFRSHHVGTGGSEDLSFVYAHYALQLVHLCSPALSPVFYVFFHHSYRSHLPFQHRRPRRVRPQPLQQGTGSSRPGGSANSYPGDTTKDKALSTFRTGTTQLTEGPASVPHQDAQIEDSFCRETSMPGNPPGYFRSDLKEALLEIEEEDKEDTDVTAEVGGGLGEEKRI